MLNGLTRLQVSMPRFQPQIKAAQKQLSQGKAAQVTVEPAAFAGGSFGGSGVQMALPQRIAEGQLKSAAQMVMAGGVVQGQGSRDCDGDAAEYG